METIEEQEVERCSGGRKGRLTDGRFPRLVVRRNRRIGAA